MVKIGELSAVMIRREELSVLMENTQSIITMKCFKLHGISLVCFESVDMQAQYRRQWRT